MNKNDIDSFDEEVLLKIRRNYTRDEEMRFLFNHIDKLESIIVEERLRKKKKNEEPKTTITMGEHKQKMENLTRTMENKIKKLNNVISAKDSELKMKKTRIENQAARITDLERIQKSKKG